MAFKPLRTCPVWSDNMTVEEKLLAYNRANRAVAILCNHQRAAPKTFEKSMLALQEKVRLRFPVHFYSYKIYPVNTLIICMFLK